MKKILPLLALTTFLSLIAVSVCAQPAQPSAVPVCQPFATSTDDLQTQEFILAELKCRRTENAGLLIEKQGLADQIEVLNRRVAIEVERGDFFKAALEKAEKMDANAQRMDTNAVAIQHSLEGTVTDLRGRNAELTDDLRSCQAGQKYIAAGSALLGGFVGYKLGQRGGIVSNRAYDLRYFDTPQMPAMPQPFRMPEPKDLVRYLK